MHGQIRNTLALRSPKAIHRDLDPTPRETWENLGETRGGCGKWRAGAWSMHKSGNCQYLRRVTRKDRGKVTIDWRAYRNSPTLCRTVPSPTPYGIFFPRFETPIAIISGTGINGLSCRELGEVAPPRSGASIHRRIQALGLLTHYSL